MNQLTLDFSRQHFHDTIGLSPNEKSAAEAKARTQEERIHYLFRVYKQGTPSWIWKQYRLIWPACPLTSIRRGLSNLTRDGVLEMTEELRTGEYGYMEHCWRLIEN